MTSFMLWFDHELLQQGEAYINKTGQLYPQEDPRLPDSYQAFASPYKQWVNDSSVTGDTNPSIPTSFNGLGRADGIIFDFENGRIIDTGNNFTDSSTITGEFAVKDFNIYFTNETEEDLILENKFASNSRYNQTPQPVDPYDQMVPAIFINCEYARNEGFALGGEDLTTNRIRAVILTEDSFQLDGALSIFADSARKNVKKVNFTEYPLSEYGDIKGGNYNYTSLIGGASDSYFIDDVTVSKISDKSKSKIPGDLNVGFIDFEVSISRFPRS